MILTKLPGQNDPYGRRDVEDITDQYKQRERTDTERAANFRAMRVLAAYVTIYILVQYHSRFSNMVKQNTIYIDKKSVLF